MARNKTSVEEKYNAPFPTALRTLMEERGETQENIAKAAGKTRQTISQYVNGISEPGYDVLVKIADYLDVSIDYLLGRTGDPKRLPCAVDELGLSSEALSHIKWFPQYMRNTISEILSHARFHEVILTIRHGRMLEEQEKKYMENIEPGKEIAFDEITAEDDKEKGHLIISVPYGLASKVYFGEAKTIFGEIIKSIKHF